MKNKCIIILASIVFSPFIFAQTKEIVNPKGKWFFGAEMGINNIYSISPNINNLQGGVLAEYYFAKQWSVSGRIKYFETGVSFYRPESRSYSPSQGMGLNLSGLFDHDAYYGDFRGAVVSLPINVKWEFRLYKNFKGNIKLGASYNFETKSDYQNYTSNVRTDYPTSYASIVSGVGLNYFINSNSAIYLETELIQGSEKAKLPSMVGDGKRYALNQLFSIGYKFNLKK